jgi:hypothetical protein
MRLRSANTADSQPTLLGELTDSSLRRNSSRAREFDIMASDHVSFQLRFSPYPQDDGPEDHHEQRFHSAQQQYFQQWDPPSFGAPSTFSLQDFPSTYNVSGVLTQDVDTSIQRSQPESLLDLGQLQAQAQDAVNKLPIQSFVKPPEEGWRPPFMARPTNVPLGYHNQVYTRSPGVMSEPVKDEELCSIVESDLGSNFDSGFYSQAPWRKNSSFRQDINRDDQSEVSAISGAHPTFDVARPSAGRRILSDSHVGGHNGTAHHGKRRRPSQPLPPCSVCKTFFPKNRSDQTYVSSSLYIVRHFR